MREGENPQSVPWHVPITLEGMRCEMSVLLMLTVMMVMIVKVTVE